MAKLGMLDLLALALVIVGALNWGLVGALNFNLVEKLLGQWPMIVRIVYGAVGVAGLYVAALSMQLHKA